MGIKVNLRKLLHRKVAEMCTPSSAGNTVTGGFFVSDKSDIVPMHDSSYYVAGASSIWCYNADNDGWMQIKNSGIAGAFGAGSCGEYRATSAPGGTFDKTATGGTTFTINTNLTIVRCLKGYKVMILAGPNAGMTCTIKSNTLGANSIITIEDLPAQSFSSSTVYRILGGSLWFFNAGTTAVGFSVYDRITDTWTSRSVTGLPTAWGTDGQLVSTPGYSSNNGLGFAVAPVVSATSTTVMISDWAALQTDQWKNFQLRIISGTGAGQIRPIASNTADTLTVSSAFTVTPDVTSVIQIEGNDDYFYLMGNNAVTMYRFSVSGNTWTTLSPTVARSSAPGAGATLDWIDGVTDAKWTENAPVQIHYDSTVDIMAQNGRYMYSFRGAGTSTLHVYDIAANTWINDVVYANQNETFTTGSCSVDMGGMIYLQKDSTGRIYVFDVCMHKLDPYVYNPVPQGTAVVGDKMIIQSLTEGGTTIRFLYSVANTRAELVRWVMI